MSLAAFFISPFMLSINSNSHKKKKQFFIVVIYSDLNTKYQKQESNFSSYFIKIEYCLIRKRTAYCC